MTAAGRMAAPTPPSDTFVRHWPVGRLPFDRAEHASADDEDAHVAAAVIDGALHVEDGRSCSRARTTRNATSGSLDAHHAVPHRAEDRLDDRRRPSPARAAIASAAPSQTTVSGVGSPASCSSAVV